MDLSPIFGLNCRFGAVLREIPRFPHWVRSCPLNTSVYQRVLAVAALPVRIIVTSGGWGVCDGVHRIFVMERKAKAPPFASR